MKTIFNAIIKAVCIIVIVIMTSITVKAQFNIGGPGTNGSGINGNGTNDAPSPTVPLDGGMSILLLASGISYGAKKLRNKKRSLIL